MDKFVRLKEQNPKLKVLVSIGGWNAGSVEFSKMANSGILRTQFAINVVYFLRTHHFDGLDIKWGIVSILITI
jgi:chitinase